VIIKYNPNSHYIELLGFVLDNPSLEFYYTENNERKFIKDDLTLKNLLKNSNHVFIEENSGSISGLILLWEARGGDKVREYVKFLVSSETVLSNLLKVFSYTSTKDLYIKVKKDSKYLQTFKNNNFQFKNGRGNEVLLMYKKD
jgi:hypothetical protein